MACSKTESASWTTDASAPPALASCAPRPLPLPSRAARAAWQTGHHWHSGASLGGGSLVAVSHTSPLSLCSVPRVRLTWPATWLAMLRAPAFISQRWKSATGSLLLGWPRPPPDWPLPPLLCWPDWGWLGLGRLGLGWLDCGWPDWDWPSLFLGWALLFGWALPSGWPSPRDSDT